MNEWKEYKLGEILTLNYGKALKEQDRIKGEYPVYSSAGLTGYHNKPLVSSKGLIIGRKGTIGKVYYSHKPFYCIDTAYYILPKEDVYDMSYLYYALQTLHLEELNEDSAVPGLNRDTAYSQFILLPPLPEQRAIAAVLSSLDDKIDLLHRQNKTLEAMAETLFRQWFVEEAGEDWEEQILMGDLIDSVSVTHKFPKKEIIFLNTSDVYLGDVLVREYSEVKDLPGQAKKTIQKDDILFSEIRPANGRWAYVDFDGEDYVVSTKLMVLRNKGVVNQSFVYFYLINSRTIEWLQVLAEGRSGTFPQITFDQIKTLKINIPNKNKLKETENWCAVALNKIKNNQSQIRTLTQTRDILLPKLMSGEIRIKI